MSPSLFHFLADQEQWATNYFPYALAIFRLLSHFWGGRHGTFQEIKEPLFILFGMKVSKAEVEWLRREH